MNERITAVLLVVVMVICITTVSKSSLEERREWQKQIVACQDKGGILVHEAYSERTHKKPLCVRQDAVIYQVDVTVVH